MKTQITQKLVVIHCSTCDRTTGQIPSKVTPFDVTVICTKCHTKQSIPTMALDDNQMDAALEAIDNSASLYLMGAGF